MQRLLLPASGRVNNQFAMRNVHYALRDKSDQKIGSWLRPHGSHIREDPGLIGQTENLRDP